MSTTLNRRTLLGGSVGLLAAGVAAGTAALATAMPSEDAPAWRCWRQKDKADLDDRAYLALCGSLAPSAHNTQPWKFHLADDRIEVHADRSRHLGSADEQRRMMQLSIGCAVENMVVAAQRLGWRAELQGLDAPAGFDTDGPCAVLQLHAAAPRRHPWFDAIFERRTTRGRFEATGLAAGLAGDIHAAVGPAAGALPGIGLHWFEGPNTVQQLERLVRASVRSFLTQAHHRDGMAWFRITRDEWQRRRDGIAIFTSDAPFYAKRYVEWFATERDLLSEPFRQGEIEAVDRLVPATPLWGLVHADRAAPGQRLQAGRMAERLYLEATRRGLALQPLCYPTEVAEQAASLGRLAGLPAAAEPLFLFRLGKGEAAGRSVRRELTDVLMA